MNAEQCPRWLAGFHSMCVHTFTEREERLRQTLRDREGKGKTDRKTDRKGKGGEVIEIVL